jgi:hypothetical protein
MLTIDYPNVLVPISLKHEVSSQANNSTKPASAGVLLRMLIGTLLDGDDIWNNTSAEKLLADHSDTIAACKGNFNDIFLNNN